MIEKIAAENSNRPPYATKRLQAAIGDVCLIRSTKLTDH